MATVQRTRSISQPQPRRHPDWNASARPDIHRETFPTALGDASDDFLGMPAGSRDHVSSSIRMDTLHQRSERSDDVCDASVRVSGGTVSSAYLHGISFVSRP